MKVARDAKNLYFYAETAADLTPHTDPHWMLLYINLDQCHKTGWEGYDYVVNLAVSEKTTSLHRLRDGWNPELVGEIAYAINGNRLELARIATSDIAAINCHCSFVRSINHMKKIFASVPFCK
jgi:hypothetical protein